jgi:hypothetical protein
MLASRYQPGVAAVETAAAEPVQPKKSGLKALFDKKGD